MRMDFHFSEFLSSLLKSSYIWLTNKRLANDVLFSMMVGFHSDFAWYVNRMQWELTPFAPSSLKSIEGILMNWTILYKRFERLSKREIEKVEICWFIVHVVQKKKVQRAIYKYSTRMRENRIWFQLRIFQTIWEKHFFHLNLYTIL